MKAIEQCARYTVQRGSTYASNSSEVCFSKVLPAGEVLLFHFCKKLYKIRIRILS